MKIERSRLRFTIQWLPAILGFISTFVALANQLGYLATSLLACLVAVLLWLGSNRIVEKAMPQPQPTTQPQPIVSLPPKSSNDSTMRTRAIVPPSLHPVCDVGPYKVDAGELLSIPLDATQGQKVKGHLEEVNGQPFDWYIADEKNMVLLKKGERRKFKPIDEGYDDPAYTVSRKIPWKARWFLILDTYGKQYGRVVRVDFEHLLF